MKEIYSKYNLIGFLPYMGKKWMCPACLIFAKQDAGKNAAIWERN